MSHNQQPTGLPMDLAPRDGTMLRLLVQFENTSFEDSDEPCWTVGFNNEANTKENLWQFAGWDWTHDCIRDGDGKPIGWLPMHDNTTDAVERVEAGVREREALVDIVGMIEGCADVAQNPDSLPQMILHHARAALIPTPTSTEGGK